MKKYIILSLFLILLTGCSEKELDSNTNNDTIKEEINILEDASSNKEELEVENTNDEDLISNEENPNEEELISEEYNDYSVDTANIDSEEDLVLYFSNLKDDIKKKWNSDSSKKIKEKIYDKLEIAYGFCFKGEDINGYTLKGISTKTKEKILEIVFDIDDFLERKSPGYKESFKDSYNNMIETTKKSLNIIKDSILDFIHE